MLSNDNGEFLIADGLLFKKIDNTILCTTKLSSWNINREDMIMKVTHLGFNERDILNLTNEEAKDYKFSADTHNLSNDIYKQIKEIIMRFVSAVENKEYHTYQKITPQGLISKEIVYAHEVSTHKRHFWEDSGRFKIPLMKREEWESKGYGTDEVVFLNGELRRDVPYKVIGSFIVGEDKPRKENNRVIEILKGKILRQENKLCDLIREIYQDKLIRRHDRITLHGLELDIVIPELRLAFEYDGEQHYDKELYAKLYGDGFDAMQRRDRTKDKLCRRKNIRLIRIKYDEPLTKRHILFKIRGEKTTNGI
jgi:hypothetical protein